MSEPRRVLQVLTIMNQGGAETMVMNYYRTIDRTKVQFDFLVHRLERGAYDDEIDCLGGHIYRAMPIRPWNILSYFRWLDNFFIEHHNYIAVHSHIQENSGYVFMFAQKHNIYNCISHSHIADLGFDYKYLFREIGKQFVLKYATRRLSCGEVAGRFLYGERAFQIFNNAIDSRRFVFSTEIRSAVRDELGLDEGVYILGSVARFGYQKNHSFMLDVMASLLKKDIDARLLLVGGGEEEANIRQKVEDLGITANVIFLGLRNDIHRLLQAFDVFLMPSLFEGLPVSIIEAQASGLKCLLSDTIDRSVDLTGNVDFLSLSTPADDWAEHLLNMREYHRTDTSRNIIQAAYDVNENINTLYNIYLGETEKTEPLVTVGIPVYNASKYVKQSILSVIGQTYKNFELIITNDGSTDNSWDEICQITDSRIRRFNDGCHKGISARLNEQVQIAQGKYFFRMDADDIMLPCRLEKQVQFLIEHPEANVVGSSVSVINEDGDVVGWRGRKYSKQDTCNFQRVTDFLHPTIAGETSWFKSNPYCSDCDTCEDYDLWLRTQSNSIFYELSSSLLLYRDYLKRDLSSYLRKREVERLVLKRNRGQLGVLNYIVLLSISSITTLFAGMMMCLGFEKKLFAHRNHI